MDKNLAQIELLAMHGKAEKLDNTDRFTFLLNAGIPKEIITRLEELLEVSIKIGSTIVNFGKIIIMKLIEFIKENPHLTIGMILGVYFGTVMELPVMEYIPDMAIELLNAISFYALLFIGAIAGVMKDTSIDQGIPNDSKNMIQGVLATAGDLIGVIKIVLKKFIDIIISLKEDIK